MAGRLVRAQLTLATVLSIVLATAATTNADPDGESDQPVGEAGVTTRLATAEAKLDSAHAEVELRLAAANKAQVDLRRAEHMFTRAEAAERAAAGEARSVVGRLVQQQRRLNEVAALSYQQGHRIGQTPAMLGAENPREVLRRAEMLERFAAHERDTADQLQRAQDAKTDKDWRAHQALRATEAKRAAAERARTAAEHAVRTARDTKARQWIETRRLEMEVATARAQRADTEGAAGLRGSLFEANVERGQDRPPGTSGEVETVVRRALSQIGVSYAWGGGNAAGPSLGVRDGGPADAHGDHQKRGFDCSGLMTYAFAGVGIELPHYSGYQYKSGRKVPLSKMRRGDLLFWQDGGRIHHVALYLGENRMVEAPYSGEHVRVSAVTRPGLAPHAVRLL